MIHQILLKNDLPNVKSDVDKKDINKLNNVPTSFNSLKSKIGKLDVKKLVAAAVDLRKLSDGVKKLMLLKRCAQC